MLVSQFRIRAYFFSTGEGAHDVRVDVGSAPTGVERRLRTLKNL